jgi:predicted hotdog family 3-hydroxylacyl-ACP dehydratase
VTVVLARHEVERLLPQKGLMCLIDTVLELNGEAITCAADASRPDHPLRERNALSVVHSIEYAAQAAALHRLTQDPSKAARGGLLLQVRDTHFLEERLDQLAQPLVIEARCGLASSEAARYLFRIYSGERIVSTGDMTIRLT